MSDTLRFPIRGDRLGMTVSVTARLADIQSPFQRIEIIQTETLGAMLLLDGHVQLAEFDEHAYHESLVHPAVLSVPNATRALVVGGGDGGVVRELCRHPNLTHIDMVEIDQAVVDACSEFLPTLNGGCLSDPRVHLHITDAFEFVKSAEPGYDVVIMDSTDVYEEEEGELSERLWTNAFYQDLKRLLKPKGVLATQADNIVFCPYSAIGILDEFGLVFDRTGSYFGLVPSFGGYSGFAWASSEGSVRPPSTEAIQQLKCRYLTEQTVALGFGPLPFVSS